LDLASKPKGTPTAALLAPTQRLLRTRSKVGKFQVDVFVNSDIMCFGRKDDTDFL
jgi:hypothetical protein